jgi:hypothetical protein
VDLEQMKRQGWRVQLISHRPRRRRFVAFPLLAVLAGDTPTRWVVEYRR